jgi:hypothetical protein
MKKEARMKHLKPLYILIAVLALASPYLAKDKIIESKWTPTALQIDGKISEWADDVRETQKSEQVSYAFKNDAEFLFVLFVFNESKTVSSINQTGMTFWVNTEGKEKKIYGLKFYPKTLTGEQLIKEMESKGETVAENKKEEVLKAKVPFRVFACDAVNKKGEIIPHPGKGIATFRTGQINKDLIYEFVIPLALLSDPTTQTPFDPAKPFKLGFNWGGMTEEMKKAQAAQLGDQGVQARASAASGESATTGGESGGFNAPGADLASMRRMAQRAKEYDFWIDLKLAAKQ